MSFNSLRYQIDDKGVVVITVNRPDKLNALNNKLLDELSEAFRQGRADEQIKGIILTGAGNKAFVAGADIKELQLLNEDSGRMASQRGQQIFQSIEGTPKPVIAAVNGYALGGGAELAMACHLRIASPEAVFGLPEVGLGLIPGYGGTQRLPKIVGRARALEMVLTAKQIKARQAFDIGLVNRLADDPLSEAQELMKKILSNAPLAVCSAIKAVYDSAAEDSYETEASLFGSLCSTEDAKEGTAAFLKKRKPKFKGR